MQNSLYKLWESESYSKISNSLILIYLVDRIHIEGVDIQIPNLYPAVKFPVSRGTPMVSPHIKWDHSEDWFVSKFEDHKKIKSGERKLVITLADLDYEYITGHAIDGTVFFLLFDIMLLLN